MTGGVVVTGASSGIGECVVRRLLARGEAVLAVARREDRLRALCDGNPRAFFLSADLCADDAPERVAENARSAFGCAKGFVHCAGFSSPAPLGLIDAQTAHRLFAVHALFPLRFLGWMAKGANHVAGASAVLVTSLAARAPAPGNAAYAAAKGAAEGMLRTAAAELAVRGLRVNAIDPGIVETNMAKSTWLRTMPAERQAELKREYPNGFRSPDEVAREIVDLLDSPAEANGEIRVLRTGEGT